MITGIVVALPEEIETLKAYPGGIWQTTLAKGDCVVLNKMFVIAYSGAGAKNAQIASEKLIANGAGSLISWGCAGALTATLKPGDLVLADNIVCTTGSNQSINSHWHKLVQKQLATFIDVQVGNLLTTAKLISLARDKHQLHKQTGAIAVDMESLSIAKVAKQHNIPFLAIRVIVDPVGMSLPKAIAYALNEQGDIVLSRLLKFLLQHPGELPGLITLGLNFYAAKNTLRKIAGQLNSLRPAQFND